MSKLCGIDPGNKNSVVGIPSDNGVNVVSNQGSTRITPTMVTYTNERRYGGELARQHQMEYCKSTITQLNRLVGMLYDTEYRKEFESSVCFPLVSLPDGFTGVEVQYGDNKVTLRPEQCIAFLIKELLSLAKAVNQEASRCYITVSPWWTNFHRRAIMNAAKVGGIECPALVNSTAAAAVSYVKTHPEILPPKEAQPVPVMFIDIGDTSMSVSVANVKQGYVKVLSHACDTTLGGAVFTDELIPYLLDRTMQKYKIDPRQSPRAWMRFQEAAEKLKKTLSINPVVPFDVPTLMNDIDVNFLVKREDFNQRISHLVDRIAEPIERALEGAGVNKEDLFAVEALGGGCRIPLVKEKIAEVVEKEIAQSMNLDECFAIGTAYTALSLEGDDKSMEIHDVTTSEVKASCDEDESIVLFKQFEEFPATTSFTVHVNGHKSINIASSVCPIGTINVDLDHSEADVEINVSLSQSSIFLYNSAKVVNNEGEEEPKLTVSFSFFGDMTPGQLEEFKNTENEMSDKDEIEKNIDTTKNDLESAIFQAENATERDYPDSFEPSELVKFKKEIQDIHEWFEENEFERFPIEEYKTRLDAIKEHLTPVKKRARLFRSLIDELAPLKDKANDLLVVVKTDADRTDGGEKEALQKEIQDFLEELDKALSQPKYIDPTFTAKEFIDRMTTIENRKDALQRLPLKPVPQKPQKPTRIETPEQQEEEQNNQSDSEEEEEEEEEEQEEQQYRRQPIGRDFWGRPIYADELRRSPVSSPKPAPKPKPKPSPQQKPKPRVEVPEKKEESSDDDLVYDRFGRPIGKRSELMPNQQRIDPRRQQMYSQPQVEDSEEEEYYEDPLSMLFGGQPRRRPQQRRQTPQRDDYRPQRQDYRRRPQYYDYDDDEDDGYGRQSYNNMNPYQAWQQQQYQRQQELERRKRQQEEEERRIAEKRRKLEEEEKRYRRQQQEAAERAERLRQQQMEAERARRSRMNPYGRAGPGFDFWEPQPRRDPRGSDSFFGNPFFF